MPFVLFFSSFFVIFRNSVHSLRLMEQIYFSILQAHTSCVSMNGGGDFSAGHAQFAAVKRKGKVLVAFSVSPLNQSKKSYI